MKQASSFLTFHVRGLPRPQITPTENAAGNRWHSTELQAFCPWAKLVKSFMCNAESHAEEQDKNRETTIFGTLLVLVLIISLMLSMLWHFSKYWNKFTPAIYWFKFTGAPCPRDRQNLGILKLQFLGSRVLMGFLKSKPLPLVLPQWFQPKVNLSKLQPSAAFFKLWARTQ